MTFNLDLSLRSRKLMSLDVAYYIIPWYQVWWLRVNALRDIAINLFHVTFDPPLWPSAFVKFTCTIIIRCILCCCTLIPSMKFVGSIEFEIWTIVRRKLKWRHNDVITCSNLIKFKHKSTKGISKRLTEFWLDIRELKSKVRKLTENCEGKMDITPLWPWSLTQGHQFQ